VKLSKSNISAWVEAAINQKRCAPGDVEAAGEALAQSLQTIYKAVAFDVDGTLTVPESAALDPEACNLVAHLLRRGCHVWLVTGRGTSGAKNVAQDLVRHTDLEPDERMRLRCVTHNGALVQETDPTRPGRLFGVTRTLLDPPDFEQVGGIEGLRQKVEAVFAEARLVPVALTKEPSEGKAFGMRALFADAEARDTAAEVVASVVETAALTTRTGVYGNVFTLDLTSADKADGLARLAESFGISPDSVLRVGDQGHTGGNDETLLATPSGFSVDTVSDSPAGCFPVVSSDGTVLSGVNATRHLIETLRIAAPLRMAAPEDHRESLLPRLREFERGAVERSNIETRMIERQLSVRVAQLIAHDPGDGDLPITVGRLFDRRSGGVRINEWDLAELWEYPKVSALFQFSALDRADNGADGPTRSMYTDSGILLRGPDYYPNLTSRREADQVGTYLDLAHEFAQDALEALAEIRATRPTVVLVQIALAVMDNVRNILLQLLNVALFNAQPPNEPPHDEVTAGDTHLVSSIGPIASRHTQAYVDLLLEPHTPWALALETCETPLVELCRWIDEHGSTLAARVAERAAQPGWASGDKVDTFRWREADDVVQNISAVVMGLRAIARRPAEETAAPILAVGLQYGGLELPLLAAALGRRFGLDLQPAAMRVSMYGNEAQGAAARKDLDRWVADQVDSDFPVTALFSPHPDEECNAACIKDPAHVVPESMYRDVMLFDDNCTTGTTVQAARDLLIRRGCDVRAVVIVRFPGANRAAHMALDNHGHLDLDLAHNFVHGLVGPSPYSRLVVPSPHKKGYEDENGVFDKAKMRIRLLLHKNAPNQYPMPPVEPWGDGS
jgi:hydroxymethylpyrimidine pyrophosphatase-like HAD family hydrolase/hypoxanthine-guanine phosphoribosyltransferase